MSLTTASIATQLKDLTVRFDRAVKAATPIYPQLATIVESMGADEKYGWLGEYPGMREWIGERVFKELLAATYELVNKHWESSLLVNKNDLRDNRSLKYGPLIDGLAGEAAYHPDELLFSVAAAGASNLCFDGQFFYDTDHQWGDSGAQSNKLNYAAATGTTPTPAEFREAYNAAYLAMIGFKGDNGKSFFRPTLNGSLNTKVVVTVPTALAAIAQAGLSALFDSLGNPIVVLGQPQLMPVPYMTDATKFQVHNLSQPLKPFVFQAREPLSRQIKNMDDLEFKDAKLMCEARYNVGYLAWWNSVETTFT